MAKKPDDIEKHITSISRLCRKLGILQISVGDLSLTLSPDEPLPPMRGKVKPISIDELLGDDDDMDPLSNPETYGRNVKVPSLEADDYE